MVQQESEQKALGKLIDAQQRVIRVLKSATFKGAMTREAAQAIEFVEGMLHHYKERYKLLKNSEQVMADVVETPKVSDDSAPQAGL